MNRRSFFLAPLALVVPAPKASAALTTWAFTPNTSGTIAAAIAASATAINEMDLRSSFDWIEQQGGFEPPEDTQ